MSSTPVVPPAGPTSPMAQIASAGVLRLIGGTLSVWDGTDWVPADIPSDQLDPPIPSPPTPPYTIDGSGNMVLPFGLIVPAGVTADSLATAHTLSVGTDLTVAHNATVTGTTTLTGAVAANGGATVVGGLTGDKIQRGSGIKAGSNYIKVHQAAVEGNSGAGWSTKGFDTLDLQVIDDGPIYTLGTTDFTARAAGVYAGHITCQFNNGTTGSRGAMWRKGDGTVLGQSPIIAASALAGLRVDAHFQEYLLAGETAHIEIYSNASGPLSPHAIATPNMASFARIA